MQLSIQICALYLLNIYNHCRPILAMGDDGSYLNKMTIEGGIANIAKHIASDNTFLIANCKKKPSIECEIIQGKLSHHYSPYINHTCTFKPPRHPKSIPMMPLHLELLDTNHSIASWFEIHSIEILRKNVAIIDMSNCKIKYLSFDQPHSDGTMRNTVVTNLLVYERSFDVITSDQNFCERYPKCRLKYDVHGEILGAPEPFPTSMHKFKAVEKIDGFPVYGFLAIGESPKEGKGQVKIEYVSSHMGIVKKINTDIVVNGSSSHATISNANRRFTLCAIKKNYFEVIHCNQFVMETHTVGTQPKIKMALTYFDKIRALSVHSLPDGGFLILTVGCPEHMETSINSWFGKLNIYGVDGFGKSRKIFEGELGFECKDNLALGTNEVDGKFCIYFSCDTVTYTGKKMKPMNYLKMYQKCVPRAEVIT
ncbi:hypothetical protein QAD02_005943 [Eretmocerus hayati]|uniref:Uncharacterized protein n=1 Tax=Eretmocerus hayati TaxID=131215 RepID=A0ACC2N017_9HYME|nr:hypothetical protein QAD02_005943 [Eretmocerus hayati]